MAKIFVYLFAFCIIISLVNTKCSNSKLITPTNADLSAKGYFLGTAGELRHAPRGPALGKYIDLNVVFQEKWCYDDKKGTLTNDYNGLGLGRQELGVVSTGTGPIVLKDNVFLNFWKLEKISGDIYNIIYTGWDRNTAIKKALTVFVDDQSVATVGINVFANTEYQKWKIQ